MVFNFADYLTTGASTKIVLINGGANDSTVWNTGSYASLGANASFFGTALASSYVSVGAETNVAGIGASCGGLFSALSYVSAGAGAVIGGVGGARPVVTGVPEPETYALMLSGLGLIGFVAKRRSVC